MIYVMSPERSSFLSASARPDLFDPAERSIPSSRMDLVAATEDKRVTPQFFGTGHHLIITTLAALIGSQCFMIVMIVAAVGDVATLRIRNGLVLLLLASYAALAPLAGFSAYEIAASTTAALLVLAVAFGFFASGWIGGGDAKLLAVVALWVGSTELITFLSYTALVGACFTLAVLVFRRVSLPEDFGRLAFVARLHHRENGVPYAVAIAAGGLIAFPNTGWMTSFLL
jgi:prepilin peptidase CpaA